MHLISAIIQNYKSLNVVLALDKKINVITGEDNFANKNILNAIRFVTENKMLQVNDISDSRYPLNVELVFTTNGSDEYKISKKLYADGKIETYKSDNIYDNKFHCLLIDDVEYSELTGDNEKLYLTELQAKSKFIQIIIVSNESSIINIANSTTYINKIKNQYLVTRINRAYKPKLLEVWYWWYWFKKTDVIESGETKWHKVVVINNDGTATVRVFYQIYG